MVYLLSQAIDRGWLLELLTSGGVAGVALLTILALLSLAAMALVVEQLSVLRRSRLAPEGLASRVASLTETGDLDAARRACAADDAGVLGAVVTAAIDEAAETSAGAGAWSAIEKAMEDAAEAEAARLLRRIDYLTVIGNLAPMVGLLGTVVGMIFAFREVAATQGAATAGELASGIYQALVTTVGGLIVAIPSLARFRTCCGNRARRPDMATVVERGRTGHAADQAGADTKRTGRQPAGRRRPAPGGPPDARAEATSRRARRSVVAEANMTPMIDVVFLLIIFFLGEQPPGASRERGVRARLCPTPPRARRTTTPSPRLTINVAADGALALGATAVTPDELARRLTIESQAGQKPPRIRVRGDRGAPYSAIEPALAACAEAGLEDISLAVYATPGGSRTP